MTDLCGEKVFYLFITLLFRLLPLKFFDSILELKISLDFVSLYFIKAEAYKEAIGNLAA